jgi:hypothetical protein
LSTGKKDSAHSVSSTPALPAQKSVLKGELKQGKFVGLPPPDGRQVFLGKDGEGAWWVVTPNQNHPSGKNTYRFTSKPSDDQLRTMIAKRHFSTFYNQTPVSGQRPVTPKLVSTSTSTSTSTSGVPAAQTKRVPNGELKQGKFVGLPPPDGRQVFLGKDGEGAWWVVTPNQNHPSGKNTYRFASKPSDDQLRTMIAKRHFSTFYNQTPVSGQRPVTPKLVPTSTPAPKATSASGTPQTSNATAGATLQLIQKNPANTSGIVEKILTLPRSERYSLVAELLEKKARRGNENLLTEVLGKAEPLSSNGSVPNQNQKAYQTSLLMRALIPGQSAKHLYEIYKTFERQAMSGGMPLNAVSFADTIAQKATDAQKLDLIKECLTKLDKQGDKQAGYLAAKLIGSLDNPAQVSGVVKDLTRGTVSKLVSASLLQWIEKVPPPLRMQAAALVNSPFELKSNADAYKELMVAIGKTDNARVKASFIAGSGDVLSKLNSDDLLVPRSNRRETLKTVLTAMTGVISRDPTGVIENTILQSGKPDGLKTLKAYNSQLLQCNMPEVIVANLRLLQLGTTYVRELSKRYPEGIPDADLQMEMKKQADHVMKRFNSQEIRAGYSGYQVARTMGSYMGTVGSAIDSRSTERSRMLAVFGLGFTGSADVSKELLNVYFSEQKLEVSLVVAILKPLVNYTLGSGALAAAQKDKDSKAALMQIAVPQKGGVQAQGAGVEAFSAGYVLGGS